MSNPKYAPIQITQAVPADRTQAVPHTAANTAPTLQLIPKHFAIPPQLTPFV